MIHPTKKHLLVKIEPKKTTSEGGIALPDNVNEPYPVKKGVVINAGPKTLPFVPGLTVVFPKYAGFVIAEEQLILPVEDVIAVVD